MNDDRTFSAPPAGPYGSPPPIPPRRRNGCSQGCLIAVAVVAGCAVVIVLALHSMFGTLSQAVGRIARPADASDESEYGADEFPVLSETWSSGCGDRKVVRIPLQGSIFLGEERGGWGGGSGSDADAALRSIRRATLDPEVDGLLLEIDSGGGGITASDIVYDALLRFKQANTNRVIVAHMGDMAASGAYYICLAADRIVAHPTTITGSIGVILSSVNVRTLTERLGIKDVSVKSGDNKDLLNPLTDMTPEQRAMLQDLVDQLHTRFVTLVAKHRSTLSLTEVRALADGRIFLAAHAQQLGLIDDIGYTADAEAAVAQLLGEESVHFVRYERHTSLQDLLRSPGFWGAALSKALPSATQQPSFQLR